MRHLGSDFFEAESELPRRLAVNNWDLTLRDVIIPIEFSPGRIDAGKFLVFAEIGRHDWSGISGLHCVRPG
jgi:hypothetical protein